MFVWTTYLLNHWTFRNPKRVRNVHSVGRQKKTLGHTKGLNRSVCKMECNRLLKAGDWHRPSMGLFRHTSGSPTPTPSTDAFLIDCVANSNPLIVWLTPTVCVPPRWCSQFSAHYSDWTAGDARWLKSFKNLLLYSAHSNVWRMENLQVRCIISTDKCHFISVLIQSCLEGEGEICRCTVKPVQTNVSTFLFSFNTVMFGSRPSTLF